MSYNINKKRPELERISPENIVFVHPATIIIKFLKATFMPIEYFSSKGIRVNEENRIDRFSLDDMDAMKKHRYTVGDVYNFYLAYRESVPYTSPVESRSRFMLILRKMNYDKNGWKFNLDRVGRAQLNYFSPMVLRVDASTEDRLRYPIDRHDNIARAQIEMTIEDTVVLPPDKPVGELPAEMLTKQEVEEREYEEENEFDIMQGGNTPTDKEDW